MSNRIGRIALDGTLMEMPTVVGFSPVGITAGTDNALWFTESVGNALGRMDATTGAFSEVPLMVMASSPQGITLGPGGTLWFAEFVGNNIGSYNPTTAGLLELPIVGTAGSGPLSIALGPAGDNRLWFTEQNGNKIGAVSTGATFSEYLIPTKGSQPTGITLGSDQNLWFVEQAGGKVARITPAGSVLEFAIPTTNSAPQSIVSAGDAVAGTLYFTEAGANKIGRVSFP
jgi:virginiamycin B lyase